jgi:hypothetical protein
MSRHEVKLDTVLAELASQGETVDLNRLSFVAQVSLLCEAIVFISRKADSVTRRLAVKELRSAACRLDLELSDEFFD